jgi:hypothetical protein
VGGALGPIGAQARAGWLQTRALPQGDGILWRDREASAGVFAAATPASATLGVEGSIVPIAFLELSGGYDATGYFGAFGHLWRAPSRGASFGDSALRHARGEPAMEHRLHLDPTLRARFGRLIALNQAELSLLALSRGSGWYREPRYDTLVAPRDLVVVDRLTVLWEAWRGQGRAGLLVGPAAELTWAARADLTRVRTGGVAVLTPADRLLGLSQPRLFVWAGLNARDRNREGQPFAVFGVTANLDLEAAVPAVPEPAGP